MMFAVYGEWDCGRTVASDDISAVVHAFRPNDDSVCVWTDEDRPSVLQISLDIGADSPERAIADGRAATTDAAVGGKLTGKAIRVAAMTESGQWVWTPDD